MSPSASSATFKTTYKPAIPVVFCGLFPVDAAQFEDLRAAMGKLRLNDASFSFEMETSAALGFGLVGTYVFSALRSTEPPVHPAPDAGVLRPAMPWAAIAPLAVLTFALGVLFGAAEVSTVAFAEEEGSQGAAGFLLAVWALGSLLAGDGGFGDSGVDGGVEGDADGGGDGDADGGWDDGGADAGGGWGGEGTGDGGWGDGGTQWGGGWGDGGGGWGDGGGDVGGDVGGDFGGDW